MTRPNADFDHFDKNGRSIAIGDTVRWCEQALDDGVPYTVICEETVVGYGYDVRPDGTLEARVSTCGDRFLAANDCEVIGKWLPEDVTQ